MRHHFSVKKSQNDSEPDLSKETPVEAGRDWSRYARPERRCTAHRKNGDRCKNASIQGGNVCKYHGGNAIHVKKAARVRLESAADRMAKAILGMAESAESETVRLAAIAKVLALAGISEKTAVEVEHTMKPYESILSGLDFGTSRAEARARRGEPPAPDDEIIDAETVDDEDDDPETGAVRHARGRTDAFPHTEVGQMLPAGYSAAETFEGYPEGYMPAEVAMERAAQTRRVPDGSSRSRSARFRR